MHSQQMYRMLLIHLSQTNYIRILQKDSIDMLVQTYQLNTVTYGTINSKFLSLVFLSSDLNKIEALIPCPFLIGRLSTSISKSDLIKINDNRLSHWKKLTKVTQHLCKIQNIEYLVNLLQRNRWYIEKENLKEGNMVILKENNLLPGKWALRHALSYTQL